MVKAIVGDFMKNGTRMAMVAILAVGFSIVCKNSNKDDKTEIVTLGVVAYALTSSRLVVQGSCNIAGSGACVDYVTGWSTSQMTTDCATASGTFTNGNTTCSSASRVGSCAMTNRGIATAVMNTTAIARYYSSNYTLSTAQTGCNAVSGTFTAN